MQLYAGLDLHSRNSYISTIYFSLFYFSMRHGLQRSDSKIITISPILTL
jgi:hypothetical protein